MPAADQAGGDPGGRTLPPAASVMAREREVATGVVCRLREAGHEAYFVGGCVREMLLGQSPHDFDVTTDADPDRVSELFRRTVHVGARFGVVTVVERDVHVEVATYRTESSYSDGRRPDSISLAGGAAEDVARRDFTVNALLYDPLEDRVVDHVGGRADLAARVLRTVGDPDLRFAEDALRLLRAVRFTARLGFTLDPPTAQAVRRHAGTITRVSAERVREELTRMLVHRSRARALALLDELGLLEHVLPEVSALHDVGQPEKFHPEGDVFRHVTLALEALPDEVSESVAWATLLHDIGKPATYMVTDRIRFHGHDRVGAEMAEAVLERLRASNALRERVSVLVRRHLQPRDAPRMRRSTLRRLLAEPFLDELLVLARADAKAGSGDVAHVEHLERAREEVGEELPPPLVRGQDLREAGVEPGPEYGRLLALLRDEQLDGRLGDRDAALARLRELLEQGTR